MNVSLLSRQLRPICEKVLEGKRISDDDALTLYASNDINGIGGIANIIRERKNGNFATYIHNRYLNYSNVCILSCQFCAFYRRAGQDGAFELSIEEIVAKAKESHAQGLTEIHSVGGLHPKLP